MSGNGPETGAPAAAGSLRRRVARQGVLLFSGFAIAQLCSLARNALLGYWLSKGDFGIAATITIALQLLETVSDLGSDRLIVQADADDAPWLMGAAHATLIGRGLAAALALYFGAGLVADFFAVPHARAALELAALVPLIKGFMHLAPRRRQRTLENGASLAIEVVPQAIALAATAPVLAWSGGYMVVVWLALLQAVLGVLISHAFACATYRVSWDADALARIASFGWPIWLSAFPLVAVYQGDRLLIGHVLGMEALAGYTAAFTMTMVPGLLAAKVGHALLLPLLSDKRAEPSALAVRYRAMGEIVVLAGAIYLAGFLIAGGALLPLAFGPNYRGLDGVLAWLALMWSLRMVQAVPGMALMALGDTRPLLVAGLVRAAALLLAIAMAWRGAGLAGIAAAGCAGELASLLYVAGRTGAHVEGLAGALLRRTLLLLPAGLAGTALGPLAASGLGLGSTLGLAVLTGGAVTLVAILTMPALRRLVADRLRDRPMTRPALPATASHHQP